MLAATAVWWVVGASPSTADDSIRVYDAHGELLYRIHVEEPGTGNDVEQTNRVDAAREADLDLAATDNDYDDTADDYEDEDYDEDYDDYESDDPQLEGFVSFETNQDWASAEDYSDFSGSGFAYVDAQFNANVGFEVEASYSTGTNNQLFSGGEQELWIDALSLWYTSDDDWGVNIGKQDPLYYVWDLSVGLFGTFQGDDLDLSEVIALQSWRYFEGPFETDHWLRAAVFFEDRSVFSGSLLTDGDRLEEDDGGVANTGRFNNLVVSLDGEDPFWDSDWEYSIGMVFQSKGEFDDEDEVSAFTGIYGSYDLGERSELSPFVDVLVRNGADGDDHTVTTVAAGASLDTGPWTVGMTYSFRNYDDLITDDTVVDHNVELYVGYVFQSGVYVDFGYQYVDEFDDSDHYASLAIGIPLDFAFGKDKPTGPDLERIQRNRRN